jgi:glycosyltransferase involved in cell wall biosynthesis
MKIALGLEYPLQLRGGVGVLVETLIQGLAGRCEIVLVSPDEEGFTHPGICDHVRWNPRPASQAASRKLANKLADLGVSIAHLHLGGNYGWGSRLPGQSPFPYLKQRGIAGITTIHVALAITDGYCDPRKPLWFKLGLLPVAWLGKMDVLRSVRREIVISQAGCRKLRRWYWPLRNRIRYLYHSRIAAREPVRAGGERDKVVLAVGHLAFRKGQHTLTEAFAKIASAHPEWKLLLVGPDAGDGCRSRIEEIITAQKLGKRVLLLGSREDTMDLMSRAAIFAQPSVFEGLPLALQEAMFCGCACVSTDVLGNNELISDGATGVLTPSGDAAGLAQALERLIREPGRRTSLGAAAAASIIQRDMTAAKMVEHHLELYRMLKEGG